MSDSASGGASQIKPDNSTERVCARTPPVTLTPGHFPRVSIVCLPSGETEAFAGGSYIADGVKGQVKITCAFVHGMTTSTISKIVTLPSSGLDNGSQPVGAGAAWNNMHVIDVDPIVPVDLSDPANLATWTDGTVTCEITIAYIGSPRVVDLCVSEYPLALGVDLSSGNWFAPMHSNASGGSAGLLPQTMPVPQIKRSASDPGFGAEIICDAAKRLCQEIGPVLFYATAWDEDAQSVASTETDYAAITGTTYRDLFFTANSMNWVSTALGWSIANGANARRIQDSGVARILRDTTNSVPVRCYIYGTMSTVTDTPTATVRFESQLYSVCEIAIPSSTDWAWHSAPGHLNCNLGAQDPRVFVAKAKCSTATGSPEFRWRYAAIVYDGSI